MVEFASHIHHCAITAPSLNHLSVPSHCTCSQALDCGDGRTIEFCSIYNHTVREDRASLARSTAIFARCLKVHGDIRLLMVDSHPKGHVWMAQRALVRFEHIQKSSYLARWHLSTTRTNIASRGPICAYFPRLSPVLDPGGSPLHYPNAHLPRGCVL